MEKNTEQQNLLSTSPTPVAAKPTQLENKFEKKLNEFAEKWWARYIVGILLFVAGGFLLDHVFTLEPGKKWNSHVVYWLCLFILFGWGVVCMKELFGFAIVALIFGGLAYAFFGLIAGIPVSVAIIIGAMIIANANAKN